MTRQVVEQWDAGYPRVSTTMQVERQALQNQVHALEAYAAAQGLKLRLYREEGVSAKDTDRPKLQHLLADVRSGRVRSVVVTRLDRISRSLADLLDLMRLFEEHEVKFISLRDNRRARSGASCSTSSARSPSSSGRSPPSGSPRT